MNGRAWLPAEIKQLRAIYPNLPTMAVAKIVGHPLKGTYGKAFSLGLGKSEVYMASPAACRLRRGDNVGAAFRFPKGHVPANKGLRRPGWAPGRMAETQFKKGQRSPNYLPVGTVKPDSDGYLRRKIADGPGGYGNPKVWEFVHRRVWEDAHGPVPKGFRIWWKDRDRMNCSLDNLELLSGAEHMARTTIHNYPPELKQTIYLAGQLKRRIREKKKEKLNGQE